MNALYSLGLKIATRGKAMGWKPGTKKADDLNLEAWVGACMALEVIGAEPEHLRAVQTYVQLVVCVRGYRETLLLAERVEAEVA